MVNKKGQEMSVTTLILIVLGVVLLVVLILGFTMGWESLWSKINIFGGGSSIETVIQSCKIAASSDATYSYCSEFKKIKVGGQTEYVNCADSRVAGALDKTLPCEDNVVEGYCKGLSESLCKKGVKVNGKAVSWNNNTCSCL
jgi:hypothetical protein